MSFVCLLHAENMLEAQFKKCHCGSVSHARRVSRGRRKPQLDGDCGAVCWTQAECWGAPRGLGTSNLSLPRLGTVAVQREVPMLLCHKCGTLTPQLAAQTGTRRGQQVLSLTGNLLSGVPFHAQEPSCRRGDI